MKNIFLYTLSVRTSFYLILVGSLQSCKQDEATGPGISQVLIIQAQLNAVTLVSSPADTMITGNPFVEREVEERAHIRDIFTNYSTSEPISEGDIIAIRSFINENGRRGTLRFVDVMVKRETGYNTAGNDFEYMRIPYEASTDYSLHPNGMLPDTSQVQFRGLGTNILSVNCVTCHNRVTDFIFFD
jgi:hypothetical protein